MALNDPSDAVNAVAADYNRGLLYAVTRQTDVWEIDINAGTSPSPTLLTDCSNVLSIYLQLLPSTPDILNYLLCL